jgi:nicotinate-nucleotide--dimethylbenzimidazole phosphoribosyltransferase
MEPQLTQKTVVVFAGDHGVVEEGVSAFPQEVTQEMVANFIRGGAGINVLARHVGAQVIVVDVGVAADLQPCEGLLLKKIAHGTNNMRKGPAMSSEEALQGVMTGAAVAADLKAQQVTIVGTGDMGIGNTTPSSAITAVLTGQAVESVTGIGTGISDGMLTTKIQVIQEAIHRNQPDPADPLDVLAKVGGFEIAISSAAALLAVSLNPLISNYLFAAHRSVEPGHSILLKWLQLQPLLDLSMRLGEGTGAALGISVIDAGVKVLRDVLTFEQAGVRKAVR